MTRKAPDSKDAKRYPPGASYPERKTVSSRRHRARRPIAASILYFAAPYSWPFRDARKVTRPRDAGILQPRVGGAKNESKKHTGRPIASEPASRRESTALFI